MIRYLRLALARPLRLTLTIDRRIYSIIVSIYEDPRPALIPFPVYLAAVDILYFSTCSL